MSSDEPRDEAARPRIERHDRRLAPDHLSFGDLELIEAVGGHIERHLGPNTQVLHEILSDVVHVDLHVVPPAADRDWLTVVTSGMSERPMRTPPGAEACAFGELVLALPPGWPLDPEALKDQRLWWPLYLLKELARLPHLFDTWLWLGHSVPNGDPAEPYAADTALDGAVILPPVLVPPDFVQLQAGDRSIYFLGVVPVHGDEMAFKLRKGSDALHQRLIRAGVTELIQASRPSVMRRRWLGLV